MFHQLTNKTLVEAYENAKFLRLEQDFIDMLEKEIKNRGIYMEDEYPENVPQLVKNNN